MFLVANLINKKKNSIYSSTPFGIQNHMKEKRKHHRALYL